MIRPSNSKITLDPELPFGTNRCLCASCGCYFGGLRAFERHRIGPASDRTCLDPCCVSDSQKRPLLQLNKHRYWVLNTRPTHLRQPVIRVAA